MKTKALKIICLILTAVMLLTACSKAKPVTNPQTENSESASAQAETVISGDEFSLDSVPDYSGAAYVEINGSTPFFTESDLTEKAYESYSKQDKLGRCRAATACIGKELMPEEKRGDISSVKPTGWQSIRFSFVDGGSLYNRCHLIAYMLTGENANSKNLITGTRYMNVSGMLPFEELTSSYIKSTGNHVLYRVTPIFKDNELVARGVLMEGYSVEDRGKGICFNVFCYNVQPGVEIDYATGGAKETEIQETTSTNAKYIINKSSKKFHKPDCSGASTISEKNRIESNESREELIKEGYTPCGSCNP